MNLNHLPSEAPDVPDIFQVGGEYDDRERARHLIGAEVDEVNPAGSGFDTQNFSGHALGLTDVLGSFLDG